MNYKKVIFKAKNVVDGNIGEFIKKASTAFLIKSVSALLVFLLNLYLARKLGADACGLFFLCVSCATFAATVSRAGMDVTMIKHVAATTVTGNVADIRGIVVKSFFYVALFALMASVFLLSTANFLANSVFKEPHFFSYAWFTAVLTLMLALSNLASSCLRGLRQIRDSSLVLSFFTPATALLMMPFLVPQNGLFGASIGYQFAAFAAALFGIGRLLVLVEIKDFKYADSARVDNSELFGSAKRAFVISVAQMLLNAGPPIIAGIVANVGDVAVLTVALRTALLGSFLYLAAESIVAPKFSYMFRQGDMKILNHFANRATIVLAFVSVPIFMAVMFFSKDIMSLFGDKYAVGYKYLLVLTLGQLINVVTGFAASYLFMVGAESTVQKITVRGAIVFILGALTVGHFFGAFGIACLLAVIVAVQNLVLCYVAYKRYGVLTLPIKQK